MSKPIFIAMLALAACSSSNDVAPAPSVNWMTDAAQAATFNATVNTGGREGWSALHASRIDATEAARWTDTPEGRTGRSRALFAEAVLNQDLAALVHLANERLFRSWEARGSLPADARVYAVAALDARCAGQDPQPWLDKAKSAPGTVDFLARVTATDIGAPSAAAEAGTPLVRIEADGFARNFFDPCLHDALAQRDLHAAAEALAIAADDWKAVPRAWAESGLAGSLFSAWATAIELRTIVETATSPGTLGANSPYLATLGASALPGAGDEIDAAREEMQRVSIALDTEEKRLRDAANEDGRALLDGLRIMERFRQEWLVARAREALSAGRPQQALAYAQGARHAAEPAVGAHNTAAVYAVLARAELANHHTREALDALHHLRAARPLTAGAAETLGDLSVLEALDRHGDSKEN